MSTQIQLFEGDSIRLDAIDPEKDAETLSRWTHDPEYLRLTSADPARPLSPGQVKKKLEESAKEAEKRRNQFDFAIRTRTDDRLIGAASVNRIQWTHGTGMLRLAIGQAQDRRKGYGSETLNLLLRYAFDELNLHRLGAATFEYNTGAQRLLERNGFVVEVRRRQDYYYYNPAYKAPVDSEMWVIQRSGTKLISPSGQTLHLCLHYCYNSTLAIL